MLNSTSEESIIYIGYSVIAPLSALFSWTLMFIIIFAQMKESNRVKRHHMANIFWMSFSDFGFSVRNCIQFVSRNPPTGSIFCWLSAITGVFFVVATQSWYFIISFRIFEAMRFNPTHGSNRNIYHIFVWGLSTVATILPIRTYGLQPNTGTCWIMDSNNTFTPQRLVVFIPLSIYMWFAIVLLIIMTSNIYSALHQQSRKTLLIRTSAFVGVFVITWFPTWLWTLLKLARYPPPSWIQYLTNFFASASGTLNFIVWMIFFPDFRKRCKRKKIIKRFHKKEQSVNNVVTQPINSPKLGNNDDTSEKKTIWETLEKKETSPSSAEFNGIYLILENADNSM